MNGSYPRLWPEALPSMVLESLGPVASSFPAGHHHPADFADRLYACESLHPARAGSRPEEKSEPYTLQWFLNIENQRHGRQARWIPRLMEFEKHGGEALLGLGDGLGTDWLQYARHGAAVTIATPSVEQLVLIRRNFELRGLSGRFLQGAPESLPIEAASIDVVCVSGLFHQSAQPERITEQIYRVLKPGGKVLAVTPSRYDVDFWYRICFPLQAWFGPSRSPAFHGFSSRSLRRLFSPFVEHRVYKRHISRREVPHVWRWWPRPVLERLMGRVLVLKAFKPLSAAIAVQSAA